MKKKIIKTIKKVDLFDKPVELLIKEEESHKTFFGAVVSLGMISLICVLAVISLRELFGRTNPNSVVSEVYKIMPDLYHLSANNFTMVLGVQDPNTWATYKNDSIYTLELRAF